MVIASLSSGAGKTTVATGIMRALTRHGLKVQAYKVGPDFIDPTYHTLATNRPSRNLDTWLLGSRGVKQVFKKSTQGVDIAVIEGVMGLFDGFGTGKKASTAEIASMLKAPVILVVDVKASARSAAALVKGAKAFDKKINIAGVILNHVAGEYHIKICKNAIEKEAKTPVLGAIPTNSDIRLEERHLGLVPTPENRNLIKKIEEIAEHVENNVDLDRIVEIAEHAPPIDLGKMGTSHAGHDSSVRIAVAFDAAFHFYYVDSLDALRENGAELVFFSPISDRELPIGADAIYIGGGFPEIYANKLEENYTLMKEIKKMGEDEIPIYAECGGLMYLTEGITTFDGKKHKMTGLLEAETTMTGQLTLNYTKGEAIKENILMPTGTKFKGHEYHYSKLNNIPRDANLTYQLKIGKGITDKKDGWQQHKTLATYTHLNLAADKQKPKTLIKQAKTLKRK